MKLKKSVGLISVDRMTVGTSPVSICMLYFLKFSYKRKKLCCNSLLAANEPNDYKSKLKRKPQNANMLQVTEIQSCYRMMGQEHNPERGGNLMMALLPKTEAGLQIPIKFIGSHRCAQTDFKIDQPKPGANTFSIELHDNLYYLCAEMDRVFLQKLVAQQPNDEKYLFEVKYVNESSDYMSVKSKNTGKYLASDDHGNAFMEEVKHSSLDDGQPMDRRAWFNLLFVETMKRERESTLYSCNLDGTSINYSVKYQTQVEAC